MPIEIKIKGIKITGNPFDASGYGRGTLNWIKCLHKLGVPMWLNPVTFEKSRPELKDDFELLDALARSPRPYDINFVRLSPEVGVKAFEDGKINILSTAWETSKLDPLWVECCNRFNAVFVETEWSKGVFVDSGVTVPVLVVPNCIDVNYYKPKSEVNTGQYTFYSIQQWIERKNGIGLLKAYFNAFSPDDNVLLILKTYITRMDDLQNQQGIIKGHIDNLKKSLNLKQGYPPVYLVTDNLSDTELKEMHEQCDCYVLLDRGESLGLPFMEAAAAGNPVIATDWGGSRQFLHSGNSYCVPYQLTFVENMMWNPFYNGTQCWADPNLPEAAKIMRHVYDNRNDAFSMGMRAREDMRSKFNEEIIAKALLGAIAEVVSGVKI